MKRLDRRTLLRGAGSIAIALPWLEVMGCARPSAAPPSVAAQRQGLTGSPGLTADGFPRRLAVLTSPNGTIPEHFFPRGGETGFALPRILQPLARHRNDLLILEGIDHRAGEGTTFEAHLAQGAMLSGVGAPGGQTVDQFIAQSIAGTQTAPPFRSMVLTTSYHTSVTSALSYAGPSNPVPGIWVAKELFDTLFGNTSGVGATKAQALRRSILDGTRADAQALRAKLGAADRRRIDDHLDGLRELEQRLGNGRSCSASSLVPGREEDLTVKLPQMLEQWFDVVAVAFACDMSRVLTAAMRSEGSTGGLNTYSWLGIGPAGPDPEETLACRDHHTLSHNDWSPTQRELLVQINAWYAEQVARFIDRLKALPEGEGSVFDHSLVVYGSAIGQGNHTIEDIPYVLAGRCDGYFRTGRSLKFNRQSHNNLLVSMMNAMGVPGTTYGNPRYCTGPLAGLV